MAGPRCDTADRTIVGKRSSPSAATVPRAQRARGRRTGEPDPSVQRDEGGRELIEGQYAVLVLVELVEAGGNGMQPGGFLARQPTVSVAVDLAEGAFDGQLVLGRHRLLDSGGPALCAGAKCDARRDHGQACK